jgi:pentatricopeptide repeat protein
MWCHTCHRGRPRPTTLEEELEEQYRKKGVEASLDYYADLKQKYYGRGPYDFGENSLNNFGYEVLKKDTLGAIQVFRLNAAEFPQSGNVWDSLAEAYMKSGDLKKAEEYYQKALTRDSTDQNAKDILKKLQESRKE